MSNAVETTHNLDFEIRECRTNKYIKMFNMDDDGPEWMEFRIGTCYGQWRCNPPYYQILCIINEDPGNGHLEDVFEWFYHSCRRDRMGLMIMDFFNDSFKDHCINARGFTGFGKHVFKPYEQIKQ